jgi:hypothetical protein
VKWYGSQTIHAMAFFFGQIWERALKIRDAAGNFASYEDRNVFWNCHTSPVFYKLICSPFSMYETMIQHQGMCEIMSEQPLML